MIRLIRVEMRRMWSRRMPWILLIGISTAIVVAGIITFVGHDPQIPVVGDVEAEIAVQVAECRRSTADEWDAWDNGEVWGIESGYEQYLSSFESGEGMADEQCDPRFFDGFYVQDPRFCLVSLHEPAVAYRQGCPDLERGAGFVPETRTFILNGNQYRPLQPYPNGIVLGASMTLFIVAAIVGASFIGAEYKSGTIETTLLWEPRRMRVLGSKIVAATVSAAIIHVTLLGLLVLVMLPAAVWRGSTAGADSDFWIALLGVILRGGLAAGAIAAVSLSVSLVTRNTVGGVAVLLGYSAISPILSLSLLRVILPYDLTGNVTAFASGGEVGRFVGANFDIQIVYAHGAGGAAIRVAVYTAIAIAIAAVVFLRRDID